MRIGGEKQKFWGSSSNSLYGKANDDNADFNDRDLSANDNYSAGLFLSR